MKKKGSKIVIPIETIQDRILLLRGQKVILDSDLAVLYRVPTKRLNEQVKRNRRRFPEDFMFPLTVEEFENLKSQFAAVLRSQFATLKKGGRGQHRKYLPYAFTEHGALMAANVLNSERAVTMSIYVIRAFVRLREVFAVNQVLQDRLAEIEEVLFHHDGALEVLYRKIKSLLAPPKRTDAIGFEVVSPRPGKIG